MFKELGVGSRWNILNKSKENCKVGFTEIKQIYVLSFISIYICYISGPSSGVNMETGFVTRNIYIEIKLKEYICFIYVKSTLQFYLLLFNILLLNVRIRRRNFKKNVNFFYANHPIIKTINVSILKNFLWC